MWYHVNMLKIHAVWKKSVTTLCKKELDMSVSLCIYHKHMSAYDIDYGKMQRHEEWMDIQSSGVGGITIGMQEGTLYFIPSWLYYLNVLQ